MMLAVVATGCNSNSIEFQRINHSLRSLDQSVKKIERELGPGVTSPNVNTKLRQLESKVVQLEAKVGQLESNISQLKLKAQQTP